MSEEKYLSQLPPIFRNLYGPMAIPAAKLLWKNSGPVFAVDAMTRAYGEIWALEGPLSLNERSLATVSALVVQGLYPQIKLHINGFISSGGTLEQLFELVGSAAREFVPQVPDGLVDAVISGLQWRAESVKGFVAPSKDEIGHVLKTARVGASSLKPHMLLLTKLSSQIALGNIEKVNGLMSELVKNLSSNVNKDHYMDLLVTHLIVYCGYPKGMNAFNSWQQMRVDVGLK